jgi:lysophospholipase L1-like esterase
VKKIIFINFFTILIIILSLEIIIRFLNIVGLQGYEKEAFYFENGIIFSKPNNTFKVFGKKSKTDKNGFRIPLNNFSYKNEKKSILILGDSVTFGVGVKEKNTFIGILRNNLQDNNLYNTAIFGHNIESYSYILKKNHKKFKNEINEVVIFLCLNDLVPYQGAVFKKEEKNEINNFQKNIVKNTFAVKLNVFFRERSSLFVLLKGFLTNPIERHYNYMKILYDNEKNLMGFEKFVNEIDGFMNKNNLKYRYVLLPYAHQVRNNCKKNLLKPQEIIKEILNKKNLNLIDYTSEFCKIPNNNDLFLKYDPVHLSNYGHRFVSDLLIQDNIF